ncbi:MAG: lactate racemase domain-containing protein [Kiritimatiellae bacterium]|nr:lactate racemase domain-containing protein [Kiritimatiellia bacterium]MDD5520356.1 lactate racemase domain-containing protein [Kiritimatiellia bacterium]
MKAIGQGSADRLIEKCDIESICKKAVSTWNTEGKRVLLVVPDGTRTCPMDIVMPILYDLIAHKAKIMDVLIALGTHPPMTDDEIGRRFGVTASDLTVKFPKARFHNHLWKNPEHLVNVGSLSSTDVAKITGGLFKMDVTITCNRMVLDHDIVIIIGPVFPHEVVGFSGGNKYLFPGVAGQEIIDFFHWLGAVITNPEIIGKKYTLVREVVDRAATLLPVERKAVCMVVKGEGLAGLYCGSPEDAWSEAADLSNNIHIKHMDRSFHTVLSCAPKMYDDLWTGGKCMYKVEPVVADGGKVIIYAPHIKEISPVHGKILGEIGYHTRDYFLKQWDKYKKYPWGVVAHSTHVKGIGTYENGVEKPRVEVILATSIPEETCRKVNLGYMDYRKINPKDYEGKEDEGVLYLAKAGEILYRRKDTK